MQRRLSAHYAYIYAHFSLFDVFTVALQAPGRAWNRVVQFWQGGARLWQSPLQHLPVQFTRGKLRLVGEVSPFDSEFTVRDHSLASEWDSVSLRQFWHAEWDSIEVGVRGSLIFSGGGYCSLFEKHVSEDDGMFTLRVEGFFRLRIYTCIKQSRG